MALGIDIFVFKSQSLANRGFKLRKNGPQVLRFVHFHFGIRKIPFLSFFTIKARTPDNNEMKRVRSLEVAVATIKIPSTLQLHPQVSKPCFLLGKSINASRI